MKTRFVVNPCSGRNRRRPWLADAIRDFARRGKLEAEVVVTEGPRHATELARTAAQSGHDVVVAVGGDGTMNEVAQGLVGSRTALALVPCGSGNGLALHLGLPRSLSGALHLVAGGGRLAAIDTGSVNGKPFFNAMGLGFDAEVSRRFNSLVRRGLPAYVRTAASALRARRGERCTITGGGTSCVDDILLVAVANSDQYGNNARIAPGARVDDGMLDLVAVRPVSLFSLATLVPRLFLGTLPRSPHVFRMRASSFVIERGGPGIVHTDGETHETGARVEVAVHPRSLRVLVPLTCRVAAAEATASWPDPVLQSS